MLCAIAEHFVHTQHLWLVVKNHACVRSDRNLAGSECIKCIDCLVRRHVIRQGDDDVHLVSCEIVDLLDLDLAGFLCLKNGLDHHWGCLAERNLCDCQGVLVNLLDLCADLDLATLALAAVLRAVCRTSCEEVREDLEILALKNRDGSVDELIEVMRKDLRCETSADTLCTLCKQDRELDWKFHRLLVAAVVRCHPVGGLRIEDNLLSELAQARLDITGSCVRVTGQDVTPVSLAVNEIVSLTEPYKGSEN